KLSSMQSKPHFRCHDSCPDVRPRQMIAIPALDLRGGACVQLAPGSYDEEVIRIPDPVGVAIAWRPYGFRHLHVVDLDGVAGRGNNDAQIQAILGKIDVEVQFGVVNLSQELYRTISDYNEHCALIDTII